MNWIDNKLRIGIFLHHLKVGVVDQYPYLSAMFEYVIGPKKRLMVDMLST